MPRYYFHLHNDVDALDEDGSEHRDAKAAMAYAVGAARELICEDVKKGRLNLNHRIEVTDDRGEQVFTLTFRQAFELIG